MAKLNRLQSYLMTAFTVIILVIVCALGITLENWLWVLVTLIVYGLIVSLIIFIRKSKSALDLQIAHLQLSLFLRAENNRYYLRNGLELRPGYLAKWIQVTILLSNDPVTIINDITERQQSQTLEKEKLKAELAKTS